jgi:predicted negative regulator of RcsB-dependent stress response
MARHLDLEEQEQLEELKHFWNKWGNLITWLLIAVCGAYAGWTGWQYWQRQQGVQASGLYEEIERAAGSGDVARVEQGFKDIQDKFGRTSYAQQAGLLAGKVFAEKGKPDAARSALQWVANDASDEGYQAVARLRLASLLVETKAYDDALKQLSSIPAEFEALAADRRGDIYLLQGKREQAKAEFMKAWPAFPLESEYRTLVEVKLTALGVDVQALKAPAESAKS